MANSERMAHMKMVKELMTLSADEYRQKYELSTQRIDDFKMAIRYLVRVKENTQPYGRGGRL